MKHQEVDHDQKNQPNTDTADWCDYFRWPDVVAPLLILTEKFYLFILVIIDLPVSAVDTVFPLMVDKSFNILKWITQK